MSQNDKHFLGLDGLRGVAALVVVVLHGSLYIKNVIYTPPAACLAVDFFFWLSGFVVAHAYDRKLATGLSWRRFMTIRTIRLYPMVVVGTTFGVAVFLLAQTQKHEFDAVALAFISVGSFALLPAGLAGGTNAYPANIAAWSLFFEFAVNALYGSRFGRLGNLPLALLVAASGLALIPLAVWGGPFIHIGYWSPTTFLLGFVRVTFPFWAGVLLSRVVDRDALPRVPVAFVAVALAVLLLAPVDSPAYVLLLVLALFPVIVALGAVATSGRLAADACASLGRLSYPLYLLHVPVFQIVNQVAERVHLGISPWAWILGGMIISIVLAEAVELAVDRPVRRWLTRLGRRGSVQEAV